MSFYSQSGVKEAHVSFYFERSKRSTLDKMVNSESELNFDAASGVWRLGTAYRIEIGGWKNQFPVSQVI